MVEADRIRQRNIVEFVLYMYHAEDVVRSCQFNVETISDRILDPKAKDKSERVELLKWYIDLAEEMESQEKTERGHVESVIQAIGELSYLHKSLMNVFQDKQYLDLWQNVYPFLVELEKKTNGASVNPIELTFNGVYGVVNLKLNSQEVNPSTMEAIEAFTKLLNYLAKIYNDVRDGKLRFPNTKQN